MSRYKAIKPLLSLTALFLMILTTGCHTPKDVAYFQDTITEGLILPQNGELKIEPNDKLSIVVKTMDPTLSSLFNLSASTERVGESVPQISTGAGNIRNSTTLSSGISKYTVTPQGTIDFPVLGELKVAGMTRNELAGFIKGELMGRDLAKDPVVTVEFINMGVSMLGEVNRPGLYDIAQDKISIIEAISMAGDLNLQGKRENVTVIREENGVAKNYKVDLTNFQELTQSPVYYLKQGDIVYVEPNDMRKRQTTTNGNNVYTTGFWISVASLLTSVTTTVGVFVLR
ncbi:MAG: polysaccharide biosynthesis/export family protein [Muribaculaceae bacterium]|nr:polysaccharide biosynthesis/export family protein [Muribaculaceae bacterium]